MKKSQLNAISYSYSRIRRIRCHEYLVSHDLKDAFDKSGYKNMYCYLKNVHGVDVDKDFKDCR